jgi:hypothetical protein
MQQLKNDIKEAWVRSIPVFKWAALKVAMFAGFMTWFCTFIYLICTAFWFGFAQLVVSIMGVVVYAKYLGVVDEREYEAREAERTKRRGY